MDLGTLLRTQQADFIQRAKSGCLSRSEIEGQYRELTVISGNRLNQLRDFCWEMAEKYKQNNSVRQVFINNLKGKLGEEVVKIHLADLVTEVNYEKQLGGDGKVDFTLNSASNIGIQVKARHGNIDTVKWSITKEEVSKNTVVVCILIQEEVSEAQSEYTLLTAGFMPTSMIQTNNCKTTLGIKDLLYGAGLRSYLESFTPNCLTSIYQEYEPVYQTCRLCINYSVDFLTKKPELITQIEPSSQGQIFLIQESLALPPPIKEFPALAASLELLQNAITSQQKIAICGDYDAHGMTSTALLLRSLRWLGADVDYAIPSRMHEGYGINKRIVEEFYSQDVRLIITVNNGICAFEPIVKARELGLKVIVIDHHDIPQELPPANAILNPKLIQESSPYYYITGIGLAYILAVSLAQKLGRSQGLIKSLIDFLTIGMLTELDNPISLTGVNLYWVQKGLQRILKSRLVGVQALVAVSGLCEIKTALKPDDISFNLGFPIEAIGCLGNPQTAIDLLTTDDMVIALERAMQCEQSKYLSLTICYEIEQVAIAQIEMRKNALHQDNVLVIFQPESHLGIIRIVASRLVERYKVPVFFGTYNEEYDIRGFARGIPGFNVLEALIECNDFLKIYGGNKRCGGFILQAENLEKFRSKLCIYAAAMMNLEYKSL
jgi:single-stranded-DNA-specific exonuclease RecJ